MVDSDLGRFDAAAEMARSLVSPAADSKPEYVDAFVQQIVRFDATGRASLRDGSIRPISLHASHLLTEGVAFRRLFRSPAFRAMNGLEPETIASQAESIAHASDGAITAIPIWRPVEDFEGFLPEAQAFIRETADALLSLADRSCETKIRVAVIAVRKALANSERHYHTAARSRVELRIEAEIDEVRLNETWVDWDSNRLPSIDALDAAQFLARRIEQEPATRVAAPARASVLLPSGWGGIWMHEAVGHLLEADTILEGRSPLAAMEGKTVSSSDVTLVDDGTLGNARVAELYDDEGISRQRTVLIENGVVTGAMNDRETAAGTDSLPTGNGRRPHFGLPPRPRMTNLILQPGSATRAELAQSADPIVVVDRVHHAWLDVNTLRLHIDIEDASLIRHGQPAGRLGRTVASADPLEMLGGVLGVGDDFTVDVHRGYCVKDGAAMPVTVGQPSVLLASMELRPFESS